MAEVALLDSWIDGRADARDDQARYELISPVDGSVASRIVDSDAGLVDTAVASALAAFRAHRATPAATRAAWLADAADEIEAEKAAIVAALIRDIGKPVRPATFEAGRSAAFVRLVAAEIGALRGETLPLDIAAQGAGRHGFTRRVPYGVVGAITPFNAPANLLVQKVAPALAMGNAAVVKPAPQGVETALIIARAFQRAGLPDGLFNIMKASRSAVIKNSRDMSCGLLTYDHRLLCVEDVVPVHVIALELTTMPITEFFDDIEEGDAYINNCPYTGATHHADITVCVPVFCDGEPLFWALSRSHHADIGAPIPSTYLPEAATIYEEGVHLPCVRVQENFTDKHDIIRMCRTKIRVGEIWYGDYLAQIGACRTAERRLKELVERYGKETIKDFIEDWMDYGERRAIAEIKKLPKGTWSYETCHDPVPGVVDEGVPVKVSVTIDPDAGEVTVDARDNIDCVPGGINLSEACASASCRIGVFYNLDASIPHNQGSASRINVLLRDGCVVGRPNIPPARRSRPPTSTRGSSPPSPAASRRSASPTAWASSPTPRAAARRSSPAPTHARTTTPT